MKGISCKAICVFLHQGSILVAKGEDPKNGEIFYRPLGGTIEYYEKSVNTISREIREELGAEIADIKLLGVLESLFKFQGDDCHEIVFIYNARFVDRDFYAKSLIMGQEADGSEIMAIWQKLDYFITQGKLVPEGLLDLLCKSFCIEFN